MKKSIITSLLMTAILISCQNEKKQSNLENENTQGIYNTVAPQQITNQSMMKEIMAHNGWRGLLLSAPSFVLKIVLGEMSAVVLNSNRTDTRKITDSGFVFEYTQVGYAVKNLLYTRM